MLRLYPIGGLALAFALLIGVGCSSDNPAEAPANIDYHLVINHLYQPDSNGNYFLAVASVRDDNIIDSVPIDNPFPGMAFSHDGQVLYQSRPGFDGAIWTTSWDSGDTLALFSDLGVEELSVSNDDSFLFASSGAAAILFSLPGLDPLAWDSTGNSGGIIIPGHDLACYFRQGKDTLFGIDFGPSPPATTSTPLRLSGDQPLDIHDLGVSLSGDTLFVIGRKSTNDVVFALFDVESLIPIKEISIPSQTYWPATITPVPNTDKVVFNEQGNPFSHRSGTVYMIDLTSESCSVILEEADIGYFLARDLAVTPDGAYVYVAAGNPIKIRLSDLKITSPIQNANLAGTAIELYPVVFTK